MVRDAFYSLLMASMLPGTMALAQQSATPSVESVARPNTLGEIPVREITVFKDGHAFVLHEGQVSTDRNGDVVLDHLPSPVIGTFWPYAREEGAKLNSVSVGRHRVSLTKTALSIRELLEANQGARVQIHQRGEDGKAVPHVLSGKIVRIPQRSAEEIESTDPSHDGPALPVKGDIILLQLDDGVRVVPLDSIQDVTFLDQDTPRLDIDFQEVRSRMRLDLDWGQPSIPQRAKMGLTYLQKGIRWIPQYRLTLEENGAVRVQLQATLVNELIDLNNVSAHLVIGVPSFKFRDTIDPIALQRTTAELSDVFAEPTQTAYAFSNAIMTQQVGRRGLSQPDRSTEGSIPPQISGGEQTESLYIFTVKHITLTKGSRMVVPVGEWRMKYEDVYQLDLPFSPPKELDSGLNDQQQRKMARLIGAPKVQHAIRIQNTQEVPLTTAPALVISNNRVLAQAMTTYTPVGHSMDLVVTTAVNIVAQHEEREVERTAEATTWSGRSYDQIDVAGKITLNNFRDDSVRLEVVRHTLGRATAANEDGVITRPSAWSDEPLARPQWWGWYAWPGWWHHVNSRSKIAWEIKLDAGKEVQLDYRWHYFWRW